MAAASGSHSNEVMPGHLEPRLEVARVWFLYFRTKFFATFDHFVRAEERKGVASIKKDRS
mgnify:CR=1 FL=1